MVRSFADQVASCLHHRQWLEVRARSKHPLSLLHMKSVFVTGYALCLFPTSCVFPRPRTRPPPCDFPRPRTRPPPCVFPRPPPRVSSRGLGRGRPPRVTFRGCGRGREPPHQHTCRAGAGFPTPAPPDKRASRHSMQDTQPSTSVPSRAIWRRRM